MSASYIREDLTTPDSPDLCCHSSVYYNKTNSVFILLGMDTNQVYSHIIWKYDINNGFWTNVSPQLQTLPDIYFHTSEIYGDTIFTFGGLLEGQGQYIINDMYTYHIPTGVWTLLNILSPIPSERWHHASAIDETNGIIYVIGGLSFDGRFLSDTWAFNIAESQWSLFNDDGIYAVFQHTCIHDYKRNKLFCSGGTLPKGYGHDLWGFDLNTNKWTQYTFLDAKNAYKPRTGHSSFLDVENGLLYILDGRGRLNGQDHYLANLLAFDLTQSPIVLSDLTEMVTKSPLVPRVYHRTAYNPVYRMAYTLGGQDYSPGSDVFSSNSFWSLNVSQVYRASSNPTISTSLRANTVTTPVILITTISILIPLFCCGLLLVVYFLRCKRLNNRHDEDVDDYSLVEVVQKRISMMAAPITSRSVDSPRSPNDSHNTSKFSVTMQNYNVTQISWSDIHFTNHSSSDIFLGKGSFGVVVRAVWDTADERGSKVSRDVAVKVMIQTSSVIDDQYDKQVSAAVQEVDIIQTARDRMTNTDNVICVYGVALGPLPTTACDVINIGYNTPVIGIVMRYEGGGSLASMLSSRAVIDQKLSMIEKVRILKDIARGLAMLHSAGIVHGDVKPDNVLLSGDNPCQVRLADFGISSLRDMRDCVDTSLRSTRHQRGSPIYSAPETLVNPYLGEINDYKVALPSRRTDMYSFGILAWEVLSERKPYAEKKLNEVTLCMAVHQGVRPSLVELPSDSPSSVTSMIEECWDGDRMKRLTALECYHILSEVYNMMTDKYFDVFLSCHLKDRECVEILYTQLDSMGIKVLLHQGSNSDSELSRTYDKSHKLTKQDSSSSLSSSPRLKAKVIIACISREYKECPECHVDLQFAKNSRPMIPIIPLFLESNHESWISQEMIYYCQLRVLETKSFTLPDRPTQIHCIENDQKESHLIDMSRIKDTNDNDNHLNADIISPEDDHRKYTIAYQESIKETSMAIYKHVNEILQSQVTM